MHRLRILGYAGGNPALFTVDPSYPRSSFAPAFLYRNDINPKLDSEGCHCQTLTLSVPSLGGYYTSANFPVIASVVNNCDVILGADWLSECKPVVRGNTFGHPAECTVDSMPDGHGWIANGECS